MLEIKKRFFFFEFFCLSKKFTGFAVFIIGTVTIFMIRILPLPLFMQRAEYLSFIRRTFIENGYTEIETPLLNPGGNVEAFLDPFRVFRSAPRKSPDLPRFDDGYLITSPEYNLKILVAEYRIDLFQLAHSFREGDCGGMHTEEFLMLEWYRLGADEFALMDECETLLARAVQEPFSTIRTFPKPKRLSIASLFEQNIGCGLSRSELERAALERRLVTAETAESSRYDELFFLLFLNEIEPTLGSDGTPCFVYGYPAELAALSRIDGSGTARRFELYWMGTELANGYFELTGKENHRRRFEFENGLRREQNKAELQPDGQFLDAMDRFPDCGGVALGLDRLFMLLAGKSKLTEVTPFP